MEQRNAIDLSTLKSRRAGLGAKRYLGCIGNRRILIDSVSAEHTLTLLHNLLLSSSTSILRGTQMGRKRPQFCFICGVLVRVYNRVHRSIASIRITIIHRSAIGRYSLFP